jgi:hypothetical protein
MCFVRAQLMRFSFNATASRAPESFSPARQALLNKYLCKEAPADLPAGTKLRQMALVEQSTTGGGECLVNYFINIV